MNGVEILASAEVVAESAFNTTALWIAVSTGSIFTAIICACVWANDGFSFDIIEIAIAGMVASFLVGLMVGAGSSTPTSYKTHYKVTIDDSVSMNEFLDKYEILDQEGKILTVREKTS